MSEPTLMVRVARKSVEALDICGIELVALDGAPLPPFEAGAHVDLHLADGAVRQYSLCNPPGQRQRYQLAILRDPASRGGSAAVHDQIEAGQTIAIGAPRNHFPLHAAQRSLLFAGGIGITPIIAMAETLSAAGADFELHYSAKSPGHAAFIERIAASPYAARAHAHYDSGNAAQRLDADAVLGAPRAGTHVYVCGPGGYIDHVLGRAAVLGWPPGQTHREYFGAAQAQVTGDAPFDVRLARSGRVLTIPAGSTVVRALAAHGIEIPVSCEQGVCGTCLTRVLDGVPCHRDLYLTDEERAASDRFLPCCSRARSAVLVLDL